MSIYAHIRLQNKIIYIPVKNKIKKTNSRKLDMIYEPTAASHR